MTTQEAVSKLTHELSQDEGLYLAYQSNIAMAFYDEFRNQYPETYAIDIHKVANDAAKRFLDSFINY